VSNRRVLVIDDEAGLRHTLLLILRDEGYQVQVAEDGEAGLRAAAAEDPELILCDVRMPRLGGVEFLERYKAAGGGGLVIMMSAYGSVDAAVDFRGLRAGENLRVSEDRRSVVVTLPAAKLSAPRLDLRATRVVDTDRGLGNRIADAFPGKKVTLLDDSGPPMSDDYMATCLQKLWREAWGIDDTMPVGCTACFPEDGGGIVNLGAYLAKKHGGQKLALISSLGDSTIRFFFGFGNEDCKTTLPNTSEQKYTEGLYDLRDNWMSMTPDTWGTFYLSGQQHTWIGGATYTTAESDGVLMLDWITDLIGGSVSNVEP